MTSEENKKNKILSAYQVFLKELGEISKDFHNNLSLLRKRVEERKIKEIKENLKGE